MKIELNTTMTISFEPNEKLEAKKTELKLEVGKYYVNRKGEVVGPMKINKNGFFNLNGGNEWYASGRRMSRKECPNDLIRLATDEEIARHTLPEGWLWFGSDRLKDYRGGILTDLRVFSMGVWKSGWGGNTGRFKALRSGSEIAWKNGLESAPEEPQIPEESAWSEKPDPGEGMKWEEADESQPFDPKARYIVMVFTPDQKTMWAEAGEHGFVNMKHVFKAVPLDEPAPEGWRMLGPDEILEKGDEFLVLGEWHVVKGIAGESVLRSGVEKARRRVVPEEPQYRPMEPWEVIQEGDEFKNMLGDWKVAILSIGKTVGELGYSYRTLRPLPKRVWFFNVSNGVKGPFMCAEQAGEGKVVKMVEEIQ